LHLLAGVDTPTAGTVRWPKLPARPLGRPGGIGIVFQGPSLLPGFDVVENVALPMLLAGQDEDAADENARAALDLVGMSGAATKLPDELSGGQSQRVAIARVLVTRPALILADEPTGQLDHANADRVITVLLSTATSIGAALVVSTHDPAVAARLDDRWSMRDGRLTPPAESRAL
jgi:ABC-type lipoprotein export system ATPase subunit